MDPSPTLTITTPSLAVAAMPHLLGFHPADSLVVIVLRGRRDRRVRVTLRIDLPPIDPADPQALIAWCEYVAMRAVRAGASRRPAYLLAVHGEGPGGPIADLTMRLRSVLDQLAVRVIEAVEVRGAGFTMIGCTDARCCPAEGRRVPGRDHDRVRRAFPGVTLRSRGDLVAEIEGGEVPVALRAAGAGAPIHDPAVRDLAVAHAVHLLTDPRGSDDPAARVLALTSLTDVRVRDTVLWDLLHGHPRTWNEAAVRLSSWVRECPSDLVAPAASILAVLRWQCGDGARGHVALDRALDADPDYRLAQLLRLALDAGQPPHDWLTGLASLTRSACLGEAA